MDDSIGNDASELEGSGLKNLDAPQNQTEPSAPAAQPIAPAYKTYSSAQEFNNAELKKPVIPFTQQAVSSANNIISAFGHGLTDPTLQSGGLGLSEETVDDMRKTGFFNDHAKGEDSFLKTVNEALFRGSAAALDATAGSVMRGIGGVVGAAGQTAESGFTEVGLPSVGGFAHEAIDYVGSGMYHMNAPIPGVRIPTAARAAITDFGKYNPDKPPPLPPVVAGARAAGVIGEGEAGFMGTKELTPEDVGGRNIAQAQLIPEESAAYEAMRDANSPSYGKFDRWMRESEQRNREESEGEAPSLEPEETRSHEEIARSIEPDLYKEYNGLQDQQKWYGETYRELAEKRDAETEANPKNKEMQEGINTSQSRIEELLAKVNGVEAKLTKGKAQEVATLRAQIEQVKNQQEQLRAAETPDMENVRQKLEKNNARLGEIADSGKLAEANRKAAAMNPKTEIFETPKEEVAPDKPVADTKTGFEDHTPIGKPIVPEDGTPPPPVKDTFSIADDVKQKMSSSGRSAEEVNDNANLMQSFYQTISDVYKGAKGSAEDVYKKYAPDIRVTENGKKGESGSFLRKLNLITLFKDRNASTLMHEFAHHFTDLLDKFVKEGNAPEQLKKDYEALREYASAKKGKPLTRHGEEKIARGFERYLTEGKAPNKELVGVFARFKQWMTKLYTAPENVPLAKKLTPEVRAVFDRLLATNPEKTIITPETTEVLKTSEQDITKRYSDPALSKASEGEIENAIKEKESAIEQAGGVERVTRPDRDTGSEAGSGGDAAKIERTAGTDAAEPTGDVGGRAESADGTQPNTADFLDKDGAFNEDALNYNLYHNTPGWLQKYFNEYAKRNVGAFGNGVETLESMQKLAESTGWTPKEIRSMEIGQQKNRIQQLASADLFKHVTDRIVAAAEKATSGKPEDIQAFFENTQDHELLMKLFKDQKEYSAEASRNLGIRRAIKNMGGDKAELVAELFQRITDKTLKDVSNQADFIKKLADTGKMDKVNRFLKDGSQTKWQKFKDGIATYYVNALISGPFTHIRYTIGNAVKVVTKPLVVTPIQASIGTVRNIASHALGKGEVADRVYWGEAGAQLYAMGKGSRDGITAAIEALKTGQSPLLPTERPYEIKPNPIPGIAGTILTSPARPISAIHSFFKSLRYEMEIHGNAYRQVSKEGLEGDAFDRRLSDLTQNPSEAQMQTAVQESLKDIYMDRAKYGTAMYHLNAVTQKSLLAKIIVPFMKIGTNIAREAFVESSPLGIFSEPVRNNLLGKNGGAAQDMQLGKIAFGTALMGMTSMMVAEGNATGDGPSEPKARAQWLLTNRPNTLKIGDLNIPYQGLGSLGMLMRFSANMTETAQHWDDEEGGKLGISFLEGVTKAVLDDNWMRGVKDMTDAIYHHEEYGARYIQNMVTNWLPFSVGLGQVSRAIDPWQHDIRSHGMENGFGILDAARAKIPFLSHDDLPDRYDVFGQPISNSGARGYGNDPVVQRLDALQIYPSKLGRKIRGVELTDHQYAEYSQTAGVLVKERLNQIVTQQGFSNLSKASQVNIINSTVKLYREQARSNLMMKYPDIMQRALAEKQKDLNR